MNTRARARVLLTTLACLTTATQLALAAPKHHILVLANGDRVTGEVEVLERGRLQFSTDDAGTVSLEWPKLKELTAAPEKFEVETTTGRRYVGSLGPGAQPGQMRIGSGADSVSVPFESIVRITTLNSTFWGKVDGSFDTGISYAQANNLTQFNVAANATYRAQSFAIGTNLYSTFVRQTGLNDTRRGSLGASATRFRGDRWLIQALVGLERNDELGLDSRVSGGGGVGRYLVQNNTTLFSVATGLSVTYEDFADGTNQGNLEGLINSSFSEFVYDSPKVNVDAGVTLYPSLSNWGRFRLGANATIKREMMKDFFIGLNGVESYDSQPSAGAVQNDWNVYFSIGWSF